MTIRPDLKLHLKGGLLLLIFAAVMIAALLLLGAHAVPAGIATAGTVGALAVEGQQWYENKTAEVKRDVSLQDAAFTWAPAWIAAAILQWAISSGILDIALILATVF